MNYTLLNKQDLKLTDYFKKSPIMALCMPVDLNGAWSELSLSL